MTTVTKRYRPVNLHGVDPELLMVEDPDGEFVKYEQPEESVGPFKTPQEMFEDDMRRFTAQNASQQVPK